mgnify:CR=1 FL=1
MRMYSEADIRDVALIGHGGSGKTSLADAMTIAQGRSNTHVGAIAERVIKALSEAK